jgi:hypothetical protein
MPLVLSRQHELVVIASLPIRTEANHAERSVL